MSVPPVRAPLPDLRIVPTEALKPHEEHDPARSQALIERLRTAETLINPPIVAPTGSGDYVVLDGANRAFALAQLGYPHILVQHVTYERGFVTLETWNHVIVGMNIADLLAQVAAEDCLTLSEHYDDHAIAHIIPRDERVYAICTPVDNTREHNAALRRLVAVYREAATFQRIAMHEPADIWPLHPDATALVVFPRFTPADIIAAARHNAHLPAGISRHLVHGRAVNLHYPLAHLRDLESSLEAKDAALQTWIRDKIAGRRVRYYAEATYQFSE